MDPAIFATERNKIWHEYPPQSCADIFFRGKYVGKVASTPADTDTLCLCLCLYL